MVKNVAVVLSGAGVYDGAEIYESELTLLRLHQQGAKVRCFAPDVEQMHVVNHLTGEVDESDSRNALVEAARIVRGDISSLSNASSEEFDALIVPGGFGAAKNLCDFAQAGAELKVQEDFLTFARAFVADQKPVGLICIAPVMSAAIFGQGVECTIGSDEETAAAIRSMDATHCPCAVGDIHIDRERKLVTTPAYMLAENIGEAVEGINKLVDAVLAFD